MFHISVSGGPAMGAPKTDLSTKKNFGDYRVTLSTSPADIKAGEETTLSVMSLKKTGNPLRTSTPTWARQCTLPSSRKTFKQYIHAHGSVPGEPHAHHDHMHTAPPNKFGPEIESDVVFPVKGVYYDI